MVWNLCFQDKRRINWMISQLNADMFNPSLSESYLPQARNTSSTPALARRHSCLYTRARAVTATLTWPADDATTPVTVTSSVLFSIALHYVCNIQFAITWIYFVFMFVPCMPMYVEEVTELRHICVEGSVSLGRGYKRHGVNRKLING